MPETQEWFDTWFDSPYYHILYRHRDHEEAEGFIDNIYEHLSLRPHQKILDLACGKGRHSIYLNKKGLDVTGLDLSEQSIAFANRHYAGEHLRFAVHDMRRPYVHDYFDVVLNLFTSFGYFDTKEEHLSAICSISAALKSGGVLLLDFLNPYRVINDLVPEETRVIDGIRFHIARSLSSNGYIVKDIAIEHDGKRYSFVEKVKALRRADFLDYFNKAGLETVELFGDYGLAPYEAGRSERMIFVARK